MTEKQELHCHNCNRYVQFDLDLSIDDNYILKCPRCRHAHYRVVKDGKITDDRWGVDPSQDSAQWTAVYGTGTSNVSTYTTYGGNGAGSMYLYGAWATTASS